MSRRAFFALFLSFGLLAAICLALSPASSASEGKQIPTFTPPPTFTPLPTATPVPRAVAVFTVSTFSTNYGSCVSDCFYTELWFPPPSGTVYYLYEGRCFSIPLSHYAFIRVADNHPTVRRFRSVLIRASSLVSNPGYITAYLGVDWSAGPGYCWCSGQICGTTPSNGYGLLSCWDQSFPFSNPYEAGCNLAFSVRKSGAVRCLPDKVKDFNFEFRWDLGAGCLYKTCGGQIVSSSALTLYICAGPFSPTLPTGCRCEGPGTCYWCPAGKRFEVRGTSAPMNGVVQLSDWAGAVLEVYPYGLERVSFSPFTISRRVTLTQSGFWWIDVPVTCPLPFLRGDLGYTANASFDIVCPAGGYLSAYYAPSPTTRLVCTIPAGTWAVTAFPPLYDSPEAFRPPAVDFGLITLTSPVLVISNSYAVSEVWLLARSVLTVPTLPTLTAPIITSPLATDCFTVPPGLFADVFDVEQVSVCLDLIGFRFTDDLPWANVLMDILVLGVTAVMVFAGIRSLRE